MTGLTLRLFFESIQIFFPSSFLCFRYMITNWVGGSLLRVEPTRKPDDNADVECVAENGVGDPVSATAYLRVYESKTP